MNISAIIHMEIDTINTSLSQFACHSVHYHALTDDDIANYTFRLIYINAESELTVLVTLLLYCMFQ